MTVYVITQAFDYEGESAVGVCATLEAAKARAEREAIESGYDWQKPTWSLKQDGTWELEFGSTQWLVREEPVQGHG